MKRRIDPHPFLRYDDKPVEGKVTIYMNMTHSTLRMGTWDITTGIFTPRPDADQPIEWPEMCQKSMCQLFGFPFISAPEAASEPQSFPTALGGETWEQAETRRAIQDEMFDGDDDAAWED